MSRFWGWIFMTTPVLVLIQTLPYTPIFMSPGWIGGFAFYIMGTALLVISEEEKPKRRKKDES